VIRPATMLMCPFLCRCFRNFEVGRWSSTIATLLLLLACSLPAQSQWSSAGVVDSVGTPVPSSVDLVAGSSRFRIDILADDLVRIRFAPGGSFSPVRSPAVVKQTWSAPTSRMTRTPGMLTLTTKELVVELQLRPLRVVFKNSQGTVLDMDDGSRGMTWDGKEVRSYRSLPQDLLFYGLGEKAGSMIRRDKAYAMWNSDIPAYQADTDPLYQTIPFFYGIRDSLAFGIFFDNPERSSFDFGKESPARYSFGAVGGDLDYYFFYGPSPAKILERFTELVGRMPIPPRWSLGYQQCRWSYAPESRVREIAKTFREKSIPCDMIYLDIDYMEGYRIFTFSQKNFPQPRQLITDLAKEGFKIAVIVDPGIKTDTAYGQYASGLRQNVFLRHADGRLFVGKVWPGECAFPDFTGRSSRLWWGDQFKVLCDAGVRGFWNDMNEPSVFDVTSKTVDADVVHQNDGVRIPHAAEHNVYGMFMTQATYEGVRRVRPDERHFVLTRASYAGGERYSAAWTVDNVSTWEHLQMALSICLSMSISGQPFVGSDIGGFIGMPTGELFTRWLQLGAFTPLMRAHSVINSPDKEPWAFGREYETFNRAAIELRYKMMPYIYTTMANAATTGLPAMRPLVFEDPGNPEVQTEETEFYFGDDLLVAPVLWPGDTTRDLYLPRGDWYDYWTGARLSGGRRVRVDAPLSRIPFFVRSGSVLPTQNLVQYTDQFPLDPLILDVYPGPSSPSSYYEDDGHTFEYQKGAYLRRSMKQNSSSAHAEVKISPADGSYHPPQRTLVIRFISIDFVPHTVRVNGNELHPSSESSGAIGWSFDGRTRVLTVRTSDTLLGMNIEATK
jgi:alpha-glucosidase